MAYPAYQDTAGIAFGADASVTVSYPAAVDNNDVCVVALLDADNDSFTVPTGDGWNLILEQTTNAACSVAWMWKRCDGTEDGGSQVFTSQLSAGQGVWGIIYRFSGCVTSGTPFEGAAQETVAQASTYTAPDLVTQGADRLGVTIVNVEDNVSIDNRSGWTEQEEHSDTGGSDSAFELQTLQIPSATTTSSSSANLGGNDFHASIVLAMRDSIPSGWSHNFAGVANASISEISGLTKANINSVAGVT